MSQQRHFGTGHRRLRNCHAKRPDGATRDGGCGGRQIGNEPKCQWSAVLGRPYARALRIARLHHAVVHDSRAARLSWCNSLGDWCICCRWSARYRIVEWHSSSNNNPCGGRQASYNVITVDRRGTAVLIRRQINGGSGQRRDIPEGKARPVCSRVDHPRRCCSPWRTMGKRTTPTLGARLDVLRC